GGGVDGMAERLAAGAPRGPRLQPEVEHGLDERHAGLLLEGPGASEVPSQQPHVRPDVRLHRELRARALARRGGAPEALAPGQDARRRLAEVREPARALRADVRVPGEENSVHGGRDRPVARVGSRRQPRLGAARSRRAPPAPGMRARIVPALHRPPPAPRGRLPLHRFRVDRLRRQRKLGDLVCAQVARDGRCGRGGRKLHAGPSARIPRRSPRGGSLPRGLQQRLRGFRRKQPRKPGRGRGTRDPVPAPALVRGAVPSAACRPLPQAAGAVVKKPLSVAILWHMHQPEYGSVQTGEIYLPWTRFHAAKDYYDMAALAAEEAGLRLTINVAPSLMDQLEAYGAGRARETYADLTLRDAAELDLR